MRLRKQKEVAKENEFYVDLLQKALPQEASVTSPSSSPQISNNTGETTIISNGVNHHGSSNHHHPVNKKSTISSTEKSLEKSLAVVSQTSNSPNGKLITEYDAKKPTQNGIDKHELQYMEHQIIKRISSVNDFDEEESTEEHNKTSFKSITASISAAKNSSSTQASPSISTLPVTKWNHASNHLNSLTSPASIGSPNVALTNVGSNKKAKNMVANILNPQKDEHVTR